MTCVSPYVGTYSGSRERVLVKIVYEELVKEEETYVSPYVGTYSGSRERVLVKIVYEELVKEEETYVSPYVGTYSGSRERVLVMVVYEELVKEEEMGYVLKFGSEVERGGLKGVSLLGDFAGLGVKWRVVHARVPGPLYLHDKSNNVTTEVSATQ